MIALSDYLLLGAILFTLSIAGIFLNRKNVIVLLMSASGSLARLSFLEDTVSKGWMCFSMPLELGCPDIIALRSLTNSSICWACEASSPAAAALSSPLEAIDWVTLLISSTALLIC